MIDAFDLFFAAQMGAKNEKETQLLAQLMSASREGHLCISMEEKMEFSSPYLRVHANKLYLERNWVYETEVVENIQRLFCKMEPPEVAAPSLTPEQQKAIITALSSSVAIIAGGPGTGKSFIARHLAAPFKKVVFAAPTGKAGARIGGKTLHSLLHAPLDADLIIVDEASMIDARIFAKMVKAVKKGTRLVLMGDPHQLPPVESGSFFADLVGLLPTAELTRPMRSDRQEILSLAEAVKAGDEEKVLSHVEPLSKAKLEGQILSCMRDGPFGVEALNRKMAETVSYETIPILITRTDYRLGLYNGDVGQLKGSRAYFDGQVYSRAHLPPYEYAFCLSVHKSQGSEFDNVILLAPPGSEVFGREILYTGVTRARNSVKIYGDLDTIRAILQRHSRKISNLRERLVI